MISENNLTNANLKTKRKRTHKTPKFLIKLVDILEIADPSIISWCDDGKAFEIRNIKKFENEILPKFYKHNKMTSFQRQLNLFRFQKWTKSRYITSYIKFSHPFFTRNDITKSLASITKKVMIQQAQTVIQQSNLIDFNFEFENSLLESIETLNFENELFSDENNSNICYEISNNICDILMDDILETELVLESFSLEENNDSDILSDEIIDIILSL